MIFAWFVKVGLAFLGFVFSVLPSVSSLPYGMDAGVTTIYQIGSLAATMFPFIGYAIGLAVLAFQIMLWYKLYQVGMRLIAVIRGMGY